MRALVRRVVLLAVLVAAGWFVARWCVGSAWAKQDAERRLGRALDMAVTVGSLRLEWPGAIVLEDVVARLSDTSAAAELSVKELRSSLCGRQTEWRRPQVVLVQGPAGDWQPSFLRGLAAGTDSSRSLDEVLDNVARSVAASRRCDVANATVLCRSADGVEKPVFGGLSWRVRPLRLEGHANVDHHRASLQTRNGLAAGTDGWLEVEWLSSPGAPATRLWQAPAPTDLAPTDPTPPTPPAVEAVPTQSVSGGDDAQSAEAGDAEAPDDEPADDAKGAF